MELFHLLLGMIGGALIGSAVTMMLYWKYDPKRYILEISMGCVGVICVVAYVLMSFAEHGFI